MGAELPREQPRSVPDPEGELYDEAMRKKRLMQQQAEAETEAKPVSSVGHPGFAESLIPVWGSGREAVADFQEGKYLGAGLNGLLAVSDLFLVNSIAKGVAKGGASYFLKEGRNASQEWKTVRRWMGKDGFLKPYQHGHHWLIPQNGWGKDIPKWIKNHPLNIMGMPEGPAGAEMHGRLHGRYKGLPRFNLVQRYIYGTPTWSKVATGDAVGHSLTVAEAQYDEGDSSR